MKVLIAYYSKSGTTKEMAEIIVSVLKEEGLEVRLSSVEKVSSKELLEFDGIIIGSPTYYGSLAYQVKKLLDESVSFHGSLEGKLGGAFTSSANIGGGNETTLLSILEAMLIHGMIIQGDSRGDHYGPVAVGKVDKKAENNCRRFAKRFSQLLKRLR
ncbi:MAG: NAD(P)H-dependent oxidoreductase [Candidatus Omnitrophica bacterium]|nr:NAD(P)H-dependent oxidoreductase [Candidatus Omnitrophota bacterium]